MKKVAALLLATFLLVSAYADTINLRWEPSPTATSYVVDVGQSSGNYSQKFLSSTTQLTIDLPRGKYYISIRANNQGGFSPPSNEIIVYTENNRLKFSVEYKNTEGKWQQYMWFTQPVIHSKRFWRISAIVNEFKIEESSDLLNWESSKHEFCFNAEAREWRIVYN